jgi:predicted hydrocarbon binding protein
MEDTKAQNTTQHKQPVAFFLMPVEMLRGIHEELSDLLDPDIAIKVLYNCGVRSGRHVVEDMGIHFPDLKAMNHTLPELWVQMGLGVFNIQELNDHRIVLKCIESNEAVAMGYTGENSCVLTCGFLAGMISEIFNREFLCKENKCMSNGEPHCVFELITEE